MDSKFTTRTVFSMSGSFGYEEDKRATTNVQHRCPVLFILFSSLLFSLSQNPLFWRGKSWGKNSEKVLSWPICRSVSEDFCCVNFGGFCRGFSWRIFLGTFFPQKWGEKNPARKSAKKSGGPKIKIREKSVLPKTDPKKCENFWNDFAL